MINKQTNRSSLIQKMSHPTESEKVKISFSSFENKLSEIYQSTQMQFAFITNDFRQCHDWVLCRDFLHDAVRTQYTGKESHIYGFKYNTDFPPINLNKIHIAIRNNNKTIANEQFERHAKSALHLVNFYEKAAGIEKSKLFEVENTNNQVWLFSGSNIWLSAPQLVSMYTFLLRLGNKEIEFKNEIELITGFKVIIDKKENKDNDSTYLKDCWDKLSLIIKNQKSLFEGVDFNSYKDQDIGTFHNFGGIWSLSSFNANNQILNKRLKSLYEIEKKNEQSYYK